jgi:hypothetical protein
MVSGIRRVCDLANVQSTRAMSCIEKLLTLIRRISRGLQAWSIVLNVKRKKQSFIKLTHMFLEHGIHNHIPG